MQIYNNYSGIPSVDYTQIKNNISKSDLTISENNQKVPDSTWRNMATKYDVRSITIDETADLSQSLYGAGEISLLDHAILSFNPSYIPCGTGLLTQTDNSGNLNLISEYEARIDMNTKLGDSQSLVNNERILEYLYRLDAAKENPVHFTV